MPRLIESYRGSLKDPNKLEGIYRARVEDNQDPLMIGRVKVRVPMLHGFEGTGVSNKNLPWASYCSTSGGYQYGTFIIPEVGEYVFVIFEDSDADKPVYLGSSFGSGSSTNKKYGSKKGNGVWYGKAGENEVPIDAQRLDPTRKIIYKSPKGSSIEIDDKNNSESILITDLLGQTLKFESRVQSSADIKRISGDVESGKSSNSDSRIALVAAGGQKVELETLGEEVKIYIGDAGGENGISIVSNNGGISLFSNSHVSVNAPQITLYGNVTIIES